jgi:hypothetical protein
MRIAIRLAALSVGTQIQQSFAQAWKSSVTIMFGADRGACAPPPPGTRPLLARLDITRSLGRFPPPAAR